MNCLHSFVLACLHAAVFSKGYVCFSNADIAGNLVGSALMVPSLEQCTNTCEAASDVCSLAVYTSSQLCILMSDAFGGQFDSTATSTSKTACLRSQSGGEWLLVLCSQLRQTCTGGMDFSMITKASTGFGFSFTHLRPSHCFSRQGPQAPHPTTCATPPRACLEPSLRR